LASYNLELVKRLDAIRLKRVLFVAVSNLPDDAAAPGNEKLPGRKYEAEFREAGLGTGEEDPAKVAARVAASAVRAALVAALEALGCHDAAADEYQAALRFDPKLTAAKRHLDKQLLRLGRGIEVRRARQKELAANPPEHNAWLLTSTASPVAVRSNPVISTPAPCAVLPT
jgi:hypothetical protein